MDELSSPLPSCLTRTPAPPVALIGLDHENRHAHLWKALWEGRAPPPDRAPLRWLLIQDDQRLSSPGPKARRASYEFFIPKGILKTNWMVKHLDLVPAVAVVFIDLEWSCCDWKERKDECARTVQRVRASLTGRGTKIALVLVQSHQMDEAEASVSSERATALCSDCDLSARSLFVLPANAANLLGFILKLESAFYELAQNYYHQEVRGVKAHRDYLNKTTHLYLFVRHQFKCGFLNELKRDWHAAYKHYGQAYNLLMEVRATDTNIVEVKTVAGYINYKMCRLAFQLNLPRDAISQHRRHMDIFHMKDGPKELAFEHCGWQADQCRTFAEIFADAIKHGLPAIQTQHPGLYYQQAAQYAVARRRLAEQLCCDALNYPDPDPLANADRLEFYGQRPWRPGKVAIEPPDMELEAQGIAALLYKERTMTPTHSEVIVALLSKSIEHFHEFRSPRAESNLTVNMAEELVSGHKCKEALDLLKPVVQQYRRDGWAVLLRAALALALKCAYLVGAVPDYVAFALELAAVSSGVTPTLNESKDDREDKKRIMTNISRLLEVPSKIPSAEPGLTSKAERAAVGEAAKLWSVALMTGDSSCKSIDVFLDQDVCEMSALRVLVSFQRSTFKADQCVYLSCYIKNNSPVKRLDEDANNNSLPIRAIKVCYRCDKDQHESVLEWQGQFNLAPGETAKEDFQFFPKAKDVGKAILVDQVSVTLGNATGLGLNVHVKLPESTENEDSDIKNFLDFKTVSLAASSDDVDGGSSYAEADLDRVPFSLSQVDIEQRDPLVNMQVDTNLPVLVGEWFHIKVTLTNNEAVKVTSVSAVASLTEAHDPIIADTTRLTLDFRQPEPMTPATPDDVTGSGKEFAFMSPPAIKKLADILPGSGVELIFYLRASTTGERGVEIKVSYSVVVDNKTYECVLQDTLNLETVEPFTLDSELLSCRTQEPMNTAFTDEPFLVLPELKSLSKHPLRIQDSSVDVRHPVKRLGTEGHQSQLAGCSMYQDSVGNECYALTVNRSDLATSNLDVQDLTIGKYVVKWIREDYIKNPSIDELCAVSVFELRSVKVCQSSLYAWAKLPAYAVARTPFGVAFTFVNRTDHVQEFAMAMDSSEAFMLSGNKQLHFKIAPGDSYQLDYVLYPLLAGEAVTLPRPKLNSVRPALPHDDVGETLQRLLPSYITVLPRSRGKDALGQTSKTEEGFFKVTESVFVESIPFTKPKTAKT